MMINVALIIVAMIVVIGFTGLCTFNPGAPEQGPVQEVDARSFAELEARAAGFPVRYPQMPEGWTTNSARRTMISESPAPVIGWVTPEGGYLQLTQTSAPLDEAARGIDTNPREQTGSRPIGEYTALIYSSEADDVRDVWAIDAGDARLVLTGAASAEEFAALAAAAVDAPVLDDAQ